MKLTRLESVLGVGILLAMVESVAPQARAADPAATADVLMKVHESNRKEIELGKVAEKKGMSKEVKELGRMLVKDHTAADQKIMALAKKEKIDLGKTTSKMSEMPDMGTGAAFDAEFAKTIADDHKKDISELTDARDKTKDDSLKEVLNSLLPTLKKHQAEAEKIMEKNKK